MIAFDESGQTVTQIPVLGVKPSVQPFEIPPETVAASPELQKISAALSTQTDGDVLVGRYRIQTEIGRGGMGVIYAAKDLRLNRDVAVKLLLDRYPSDSETARRFIEEAQIAGQLQHAGIAPVHDLGTLPNGRPFLAMKLIKGRTLSTILSNGGRPSTDNQKTPNLNFLRSRSDKKSSPDASKISDENVEVVENALPAEKVAGGLGRLVDIFSEIAQTVAFAHSKGVIHRDLKPANIMVGAFGEVQVMDWGLAKVIRNVESGLRNELQDSAAAVLDEILDEPSMILTDRTPDSATLAGSVMGTPAYMPPEQAKGELDRTDARSDVFALGAILCELLTGQPPYTGSFEEIRAQSIMGLTQPALDRLAVSEVDIELIELTRHCLAPHSADRPADAGEIVSRLTVYRAHVANRLRIAEQDQAAAAVREHEQTKRRRVWLALAAFLVIGSATSIVFAIKSFRQASRADTATEIAKDEAKKVLEAHAETQKQKVQAERQLNRAEWLVYANSIDDAQRYLNEGRGDLAADELNACRIDFRGWEHDYLFSRLHENSVTLFGHTDAVTCIACSLDGRRIVSGSDDQTVRVWDMMTGQCISTLKGHQDKVLSVAISPDGRQIATGSIDTTIRIWNAETGTLNLEIEANRGSVASLAFSPDGRSIVSGSWVASVLVWEVSTGRKRFELAGHKSGVTSVLYSPDGRTIASGSLDSTVRLWDALTGQFLNEYTGHTNAVTCLAYSPDGKRMASGSRDRTVQIWNTGAFGAAVQTISHANEVTNVAYDPDGTCLVTGSQDSTIRLWDSVKGKLISEFKGHKGGITSLEYGPLGYRFISGSKDHTVRIWDADSQITKTAWPGFETSIKTTAVSPDGKLVVSRSGSRSLMVADAKSKEKLALLKGHTEAVTSIDFRPDGTRLATASADKDIYLWETSTWTTVAVLKGHRDGVYAASFSPNGKTLVSGSSEKSLRWWNAELSQAITELDTNRQRMIGVKFSADSTRVYARNHKDIKLAWNTITGQLAAEDEPIPEIPQEIVAYSPDRKWSVRIEEDKILLRDETKWARFDAEMKNRLQEWALPQVPYHFKRAEECETAGDDFGERFHLRQIVKLLPTDFGSIIRLAECESKLSQSKK